jgi:hypothetical protein
MLLQRSRRKPARDLLHGLTLAFLVGCAPHAAADTSCDDRYFAEVRDRGASGTEVTICGVVGRVRSPRVTRSGKHLAFDVVLPGGDDVWIDANLDVLGALPVRRGQRTTVRGEYFYDRDRVDGIHWTHRTTHGPHPPGFVILNGVTYR